MPIPTRSQPVSKRGESGIPTRHASIRSQTNNDTNATNKSDLTVPKARPAERQPAVTEKRDLRSLSRPVGIQDKPKASHTRSVSTASTISSKARIPTIKETKRTNNVAQLGPSPQPVSATKVHTRSLSTATVNKLRIPGSKLAVAKPQNATQSRHTIPRKQTSTLPTENANASSALTPQSSQLRDELLQLELVHASSSSSLRTYQQSVNKAIQTRTTQILNDEAEVLELERNANEAANALALQQWLHQVHHRPGEQTVHALGVTLAQVEEYVGETDLLAPLEQFDTWLSETLILKENRNAVAADELQLCEPLGSMWRTAMLNIQQQLSTIHTTITQFGTGSEGSGLGMALQSSTRYLKTLILEVETALLLEQSLGRAESTWRKEELRRSLQQLSVKNDVARTARAWV